MRSEIQYRIIFFIFTINLNCSIASNAFEFRGFRVLDPPDDVTRDTTRVTANLYVEQKIDNFNSSDTRTYLQRYHINENYYNETAKNHVFLLLGGEWQATTGWLTYGAWIETAKQYGALLIYLEHRYYGYSHPFSNISTENLQYLSATQALADTANFIEYINDQYNITSSEAKWIAFGGSYAGTLATWLRDKYPDLVAGAISSSGPLEAVLDFHKYYQVVRESLATYSDSCVENVREAFSQLEELTSSCLEDEEVYEEVDTVLKLCTSIAESDITENDLSALFEYVAAYNFAYIVQYNGRLSITLDTICDIMTNETSGTTALERLGEANDLLLSYFGYTCTDFLYESIVEYLQDTTIYASSMSRQWYYQTCTEYGFYQTSSQEDPIFGSRFNISFYTNICVDVFGDEFNETRINQGIKATNELYGAQNVSTSNIVHFHGKIDPWHALGKLETTEDIGDTVIIVEGVAHCASMYASSDSDPEDLTAARIEIDRLIGTWLEVSTDEVEDSTGSEDIDESEDAEESEDPEGSEDSDDPEDSDDAEDTEDSDDPDDSDDADESEDPGESDGDGSSSGTLNTSSYALGLVPLIFYYLVK